MPQVCSELHRKYRYLPWTANATDQSNSPRAHTPNRTHYTQSDEPPGWKNLDALTMPKS